MNGLNQSPGLQQRLRQSFKKQRFVTDPRSECLPSTMMLILSPSFFGHEGGKKEGSGIGAHESGVSRRLDCSLSESS